MKQYRLCTDLQTVPVERSYISGITLPFRGDYRDDDVHPDSSLTGREYDFVAALLHTHLSLVYQD